MLVTVEGRYKDGKIELAEAPAGVDEARVYVTFMTPDQTGGAPRRPMRAGHFAGPNMSTEEDFKVAEWHGDKDGAGGS